jgi:nucleotide-binding universal stress UspA family protein
MTEAGGKQPEIVVGIDRSPSGRAAWSWASAYSRSRGHRLRAVHVYERPIPPLTWALAPGGTGRGDTSSRDAVRHELEAIFAASGPAPDWQLDFLDGQVGTVLLEQSRSARMLVIGTREHVGVGRIVHGSVSHFCLNNANCPVAAVPPVPPVPPGHVGGLG